MQQRSAAHYKKSQAAGITIFEVLLVLVIASLFIVMGLKQYQSYKFDANINQLEYNIDQLFGAMAGYYRANCDGSITPRAAINTDRW